MVFFSIKIIVSYRPINKLNNFIKVHKDPIPTVIQNNLVYCVLGILITQWFTLDKLRGIFLQGLENLNNIKKPRDSLSVVTLHRLELDHKFDWEKIIILEKEPHY